MSDITTTEKKEIQIFSDYEEVLSDCTEQHLNVCGCQRENEKIHYDRLYNMYVKNILAQADKKHMSAEEKRILEAAGTDKAKQEARSIVVRECAMSNTKCAIERQEALRIIQIFTENNYNLEDPRVYFAVKNLLRAELSNIRLHQHTSKYGSMQEFFTETGTRISRVNPAEEQKRRTMETVSKAMKELNEVLYGTKNINLNVTTDITQAVVDAYKHRLEEPEI